MYLCGMAVLFSSVVVPGGYLFLDLHFFVVVLIDVLEPVLRIYFDGVFILFGLHVDDVVFLLLFVVDLFV